MRIFVLSLFLIFITFGSGFAVEDEKNLTRAYKDALSTLRCLISPHCFPEAKCSHNDVDVIHLKNVAWEERNFCIDDLRRRKKDNGNCLMYSVGVNDNYQFEAAIAKYWL